MAKVRTRQRKSGSWSYVFEGAKINGKRKPIEKGGFKTEDEAYAAGVKAFQEYQESGNVFRPSESSVADYMQWWIDHVGTINVRPNTIANYKKMIKCHIAPDLGGYPLKSLSPVVIDNWCIEKWKTGKYSYSTIDNMLKVLKVALDYAVYPGQFIKDNPARYIKAPKVGKVEARVRPVLTPDEMHRILERFPMGNKYHMPIVLGYHTSFRIGEVLGLTWDNVDLDAGTITLTHQLQRIVRDGKASTRNQSGIYHICPTKTKSSERTIRIGQTLINELTEWKEIQKEHEKMYAGDYYYYYAVKEVDTQVTGQFINRLRRYQKADNFNGGERIRFICTQENGGFIGASSFSYAARIARVALGIANFDFHSLRHTHATMLIEAGAPIKDIQARLGHSSIETTMDTYVHNSERMQDVTVDLFEHMINAK